MSASTDMGTTRNDEPGPPVRERHMKTRESTLAGYALAGLLLASGVARAGLDAAPEGQGARTTAATTSAGIPYNDSIRTLRGTTLVHEYTDATGKVFAVSWSGAFKPDLKQLLGRHFDAYRQDGERTAQRRGADRSHQRVDLGELVVVSGGHMGAFEGHAWLPSRLPAGFDPQEMK
jgi:hypothetical protein